MTTAAAGRMPRADRRNRRWLSLVVGAVVALLVAWLAVHITMPSFYARWWYPLEHTDAIRGEAAANGVEPELVAAVIYRESGFSESALSEQGAIGLMQVMPETAHWISHQPGAPSPTPDRLSEPEVNIAYGTWYLAYLTKKYGDARFALAAYNGGEANLQQWLDDARADGRELEVADVPFTETRRFIVAVEEAESAYRRAWHGKLG